MDLDCLLLVFPIMRQPLHIALPAGKDGTYQIDAAKVLLRRGDPSVRLQLVLCSTKKDCARCGRWDASFRLLKKKTRPSFLRYTVLKLMYAYAYIYMHTCSMHSYCN